ncbi:MAG TPA: biotin/lipoyl-containing protein [Candidatus Polarisedimenticolaceae bacterium]|nr:biotin/lipoyl-containing protein [Candidatus Polarisedimenticolaceae bacterium]
MSLPAIARKGDGGEVALGAPKLGVWSEALPSGAPVAPGSALGVLVQLGRRIPVVVPEGVSGIVAGPAARDRKRPVGYGDVLVHVVPVAAIAPQTAGPRRESGDAVGTHRVTAPTDGVFYAAGSPGAPPLAPKGARLHAGQSIGLIEVMKTFNPILYGGGSLPESAEVVEVLAADGEEVRAGQALLVVR